MKKLALTLCAVAFATAAFAQGTVKFSNTSTSLVSDSGTATAGAAGSYYYGLLIAPVGTVNLGTFTFSGVYATNTVAGRFQGGLNTGITVPGWAAGTDRAYFVAGWSAALGHDYNASWLAGTYAGTPGMFGYSAIGSGTAGGTDALGNPIPVLSLWGPAPALASGFNMTLIPVPEPTTMALAGLGAAALLIFRRRK